MMIYTIGEINKLKTGLYNQAWKESGHNRKKYEVMKRKIKNTIKFELISSELINPEVKG